MHIVMAVNRPIYPDAPIANHAQIAATIDISTYVSGNEPMRFCCTISSKPIDAPSSVPAARSAAFLRILP